jgi:hypothetical protein
MPAKKTLTLQFVMDKETKGAVRFAEVTKADDDPIMGKIYLRKTTLEPVGSPDKITVTVTFP